MKNVNNSDEQKSEGGLLLKFTKKKFDRNTFSVVYIGILGL